LPNDPVRAIKHAVVEGGHDVVVVQDAGWPSRWIRRLVTSAPCTVLVQRPQPDEAVDVLAAVDLRDGAGEPGRVIADRAGEIAERLGGEAHLVHGWNPYDDLDQRRVVTFTPPLPIADAAAQTESARRRRLDDLVVELDGVIAGNAHLAQGAAADVVKSTAEQHRFGMVVVGASRRTGIDGRLRVSTPIDVLGMVTCSVLVVKPVRGCERA
jgi:nucleotide-binding universal stress UspA family protein